MPETVVLAPDAAGLARAAEILRAGGLLAFPTETVYGLAAHALDATAVRKIFEAKGRPAEDPLIVHTGTADQVERVARSTALSKRLAERFWPVPLTLVLHKLPNVPKEVTAGLETVAVRVPAHPVAQALLHATGLPLAAPSANLFSRPSPTRAQHVLEDLDGRIEAILDGGPTELGVESTIIDLTTATPCLLRPGGLATEAIEAELGHQLLVATRPQAGPMPSPGLMDTHYAPRTPLVLIAGALVAARARLRVEVDRAREQGRRVGVLLLDDDQGLFDSSVAIAPIGRWDQAARSAAAFFDALRILDRAHLDVIFSRELADPHTGLGRALADRLRRASRQVIEA